jgi:hypothetical protein
MNALPIRRSTDQRPVPAGGLTPRDVYAIAKPLADALRAAIAGGAK